MAQLWWLVLLVIIALGFGPRWQLIQLLRLAMIGGVYLPPLVRRWSESVPNSVLTVPAITGRILI